MLYWCRRYINCCYFDYILKEMGVLFVMYELFNLKEAIHFGNSSQLLYISSLKFERDWNGMQHSHECTEIFFCLNGKGSFHIGGDTLSVTPYDFIIIAPGMKHAESSTSVSWKMKQQAFM